MRAAVARCLVAGSNNVTAGARQVGLRDNDASMMLPFRLCFVGHARTPVSSPQKPPRRKCA